MELSTEAKEARREYRRQWAQRNPDKIAANTARYWEKKAQQTKNAQQQSAKEQPQQ